MTLNFDELRDSISKNDVVHPPEIMDVAYKYPDRSVIPSYVQVGKLKIPSLFIICPASDIDYFKIKAPLPQPDIKYRFVEMSTCFVVEILLMFGRSKQMVLHLNPLNPAVRRFLNNCIQQGVVSFHYLCLERSILSSSFTDIDEEQIEWFKRNYKRAMELTVVQESVFIHTSEAIASRLKPSEKCYIFIEPKQAIYKKLLDMSRRRRK